MTEFVICPETPAKTIKCDAHNEAIDIQSAKWIHIKRLYLCTDLDIISKIQTGEATLCENKAFIGYQLQTDFNFSVYWKHKIE